MLMSVKVLLNPWYYFNTQKSIIKRDNVSIPVLLYGKKLFFRKQINIYFRERGFHSNPDLTELLINRIMTRGIIAILNDCGKKR